MDQATENIMCSDIMRQEDIIGITYKYYDLNTGISVCWHCCHPFDSKLIQIPYDMDDVTHKFKVTGCFCTINCAKSYIISRRKWNSGNIVLLFNKMIRDLYHIDGYVTASPPQSSLKMFGGYLSIEEFRKFSNVTSVEVVDDNVISKQVMEKHKPLDKPSESDYRSSDTYWNIKGLRIVRTPQHSPSNIPNTSENFSLYDLFVSKNANKASSANAPNTSGTLVEFMKKK